MMRKNVKEKNDGGKKVEKNDEKKKIKKLKKEQKKHI